MAEQTTPDDPDNKQGDLPATEGSSEDGWSTNSLQNDAVPASDVYAHVPYTTNLPHVVHGIVEISKGRRSKFEVCKKTGLIKLDRYLFSSSHYPGDYGFIPQTLAEDGDALDILVMVNEPTFSGCLIEARVVGLFRMKDRGLNDFKVLGVPNTDPLFNEIQDLEDVQAHFLREVQHFFSTYKQLEGVDIEPLGWARARMRSRKSKHQLNVTAQSMAARQPR